MKQKLALIATIACSITSAFAAKTESNPWQYYWDRYEGPPTINQPNTHLSETKIDTESLIPPNEVFLNLGVCSLEIDTGYGEIDDMLDTLLPDYLVGVNLGYAHNFGYSEFGFWSGRISGGYYWGTQDTYDLTIDANYWQITGELDYNFAMSERAYFYLGGIIGTGQLSITGKLWGESEELKGDQNNNYGVGFGFKFYTDDFKSNFQLGWRYMSLYEDVNSWMFHIGAGFTF